MLLPSALCDGGSSNRANSSTSSLRSTSSPAPGHSRRTTSSSRMPQPHTNSTLAPPTITVSAALSPSNDRPSAAEVHIASLFSSVRPGVSSAARATGILTTCKRLHQILSLDSTSRIANGGVLGCASGLTPQSSIDRDVPMARTPSPAIQAATAALPSTPKKRRSKAANVAQSTPKANAKAKAKRSSSAQTMRTVSSSSLKVVVTASQAPSTPKRPPVVRIPKTPARRNKRRRAIGGTDQSSDEDDKFYIRPLQVNNALFNRNYIVNPSTPHKRTKVTTSDSVGPRNLVFGPLIGGGEPESSIGARIAAAAAESRTRRRAMTTVSHSISRPIQASRIYNQRTQAQEGARGVYVNRAGHSRVRSMADASTMTTGKKRSDGSLRRPILLPPDELVNVDVSVPTVPPLPYHHLLSPNTNALSNLSLNSPLPPPRQRDPDAMDITPSTAISIDTSNPSARRWTQQEDKQLVELALQKLQLTHNDLEECAKSLGRDAKTVEERWEKIVKKLESGKLNNAAAMTPSARGNKSAGATSPFGVNTPNGRKMLRRTTKRIEERRMSTPSTEGSFKENM